MLEPIKDKKIDNFEKNLKFFLQNTHNGEHIKNSKNHSTFSLYIIPYSFINNKNVITFSALHKANTRTEFNP
jgi:hypothetical protein